LERDSMTAPGFPRTSTKASLYLEGNGELQRWIDTLDKATVQQVVGLHVVPAQKESVRLVKNAARRNAAGHRRSGKMHSGIRTKGWGGRGIRYIAGVKATGIVSNLIVVGARPHRIAGPVMPMWGGKGAWKGGRGAGITGFRRVVEHPGFSGDPFFARAIDETEGQRTHLMQLAVNAMAADLAARMEGRR
jgi:hypothetical protein